MPLKFVRALNEYGDFAYSSDKMGALINTDDIQSVTPTDACGPEPHVVVTFRNGTQITCEHSLNDFRSEAGDESTSDILRRRVEFYSELGNAGRIDKAEIRRLEGGQPHN